MMPLPCSKIWSIAALMAVTLIASDGAGILIQLPHEFLLEECSNLEISLLNPASMVLG